MIKVKSVIIDVVLSIERLFIPRMRLTAKQEPSVISNADIMKTSANQGFLRDLNVKADNNPSKSPKGIIAQYTLKVAPINLKPVGKLQKGGITNLSQSPLSDIAERESSGPIITGKILLIAVKAIIQKSKEPESKYSILFRLLKDMTAKMTAGKSAKI